MKLEFLRPALKYIPEVELPKRHVPFKEKLIWTAAILAIFFVMGTVYPFGSIGPEAMASKIRGFEAMTMIFASQMGTLVSIGIGPIVTASIVLQLLSGSGMLELDLSRNEDKALFQGTQKILVVLVALFEAAAIVTATGMALPGLAVILILQIAMGSILLMFMDEIVSKWGLGSGIGLFIAGGVSQTIFTGSFNFLKTTSGEFPGKIISFLAQLSTGEFALVILFPLLATIIVFLFVVYGESMRLEIPLSYGGMRGVGGRYPLKFFYVSNLPVILAAALLANIQLWPGLVGVDVNNPPENMGIIQSIMFYFASYVTLNGGSGIPNLYGVLTPGAIMSQFTDPAVLLHLIIYMVVFLSLCVIFGKFWVQTTGLGAEKVADQIQQGGMQIPGFRRDPRVIKKVLDRYIPQITIISSVAVGLVAITADLMNAIGSGTGILLTVGILYRMYEQIQKEQMSEMHPAMRKFMGKS